MKKTLIIGTLFSVLCLSNAFALDKPRLPKKTKEFSIPISEPMRSILSLLPAELLPLLSFPLQNRFKVMEAAFLLPGNF